MANSDEQPKNTNREISGVELFGDWGRDRPVEEGLPEKFRSKGQSRQISGEDLFGDAGSPEALEMIYNAKAAKKKEPFAGIKKAIARLKGKGLTNPQR